MLEGNFHFISVLSCNRMFEFESNDGLQMIKLVIVEFLNPCGGHTQVLQSHLEATHRVYVSTQTFQ